MTPMRYLDLVVLVLALPVFIVAGLPLLGYATTAVAWVLQRALREYLNRRARAAVDPRTVAGLLAGSMLARGWTVALAIFGIGIYDNEAGLAAGVLCIALFTVMLSTEMFMRPFERDGQAR